MIDVLLRDFKLESANGVLTPIGDECNAGDNYDADYIPAKICKWHTEFERFSVFGWEFAIHRKVHAARYLLCSAQGDSSNA